jgi:hypothetical protein
MSTSPKLQVERHISNVRRRLIAGTMLDKIAICWSAGFIVSALWLLAQPWIAGGSDDWLRWGVIGAVLGAATAQGLWWSWRAAPSRLGAALALDRQFGLQERVTSCLTLTPLSAQTPAGVALIADAEAHAAKLEVGKGFPVRPSWLAALPPVAAVVLVLVAWLYHPVIFDAGASASDAQELAKAKKVADKFNDLKKAHDPSEFKKVVKDEQLQEIDAMRDKLLNQPLDPKDKDSVRERLQQMVPLAEKMKDRLDDLKAQQQRNKAMQDQLKQMGKDPNQQFANLGPAKAASDALNQGDLDKAQKEFEKLAEKLKKEGQLTDAERQQLEKQLADIQKKLQELAELKDLANQLAKDLEEGRITKEEFERKKAALNEQKNLLRQLKMLSQVVGECQACIGNGEFAKGAMQLEEAAEILRALDLNSEEAERLGLDLKLLAECRDAMCQCLGEKAGGPPGTRRPVNEDGPQLGVNSAKQRGALNPNTIYRITGERKGGTFTPIPASQVGGAYQQAQQDSPQAIERQQVPPEAAEMLRGYYENLGGGQKK